MKSSANDVQRLRCREKPKLSGAKYNTKYSCRPFPPYDHCRLKLTVSPSSSSSSKLITVGRLFKYYIYPSIDVDSLIFLLLAHSPPPSSSSCSKLDTVGLLFKYCIHPSITMWRSLTHFSSSHSLILLLLLLLLLLLTSSSLWGVYSNTTLIHPLTLLCAMLFCCCCCVSLLMNSFIHVIYAHKLVWHYIEIVCCKR